MSNDDLGGLPPLGNNPLDGDLLGDMPPPASSPLGAGGSLLEEESVAAPAVAVAQDAVAGKQDVEESKERRPKSPGFLSKLAQSNPYTVMLFVSLVALIIGTLCLLLEWHAYNFDTKAKEARQSAQATAPLHPIAGTRNALERVSA